MSFTAAAKNTMLDNWGVTQLSAHTAYSTTGANEVTGGSPAYARVNATFAAASSGSKALSNQPTFNIPTGTTVRWIGRWASATFHGMEPNGGTEREFFVDPSTDIITSYGHGYANGDKVAFYADTPPAPLVEGTVYYVRDSTTDTFKVETAPAAGAVNITAVPAAGCVVSRIIEEVFAAQGTLQVTSGSWNLNG
jgi:hypothetical protein